MRGSQAHRSFLARTGMILLGLALGFAALEVALRVSGRIPEVQNPLYSFHESDRELGWRGKPDVRLRFVRPEFDVLVENDADGWRVPRPATPADAPLTVLFLGDSFTWGWGVEQGEVFTDVLQAKAGSSAAIVNRGVNAYGSAQELLLLRRVLAERRVDRVVIVLCENDFTDLSDSKGGRRPGFILRDGALVAVNQPARPLTDSVKRFFKDHSRAFLLLGYLTSRDATPPPPFGTTLAGPLPNAELAFAIFAEMAQLCRTHGAGCFVAPIPVVTAAPDGARRLVLPPAMADFVASLAPLGLRAIDLASPLSAALDAGTPISFAVDGHWNATGHRVVADAMIDAGLLATPGDGDASAAAPGDAR